MTPAPYPPAPHDTLVHLVAQIAARVARDIEPPRLPPCVHYREAGRLLGGISEDSVKGLVDKGVLHRPSWAYAEVRAAVVTTVSVFEACGWPITPLEVAVPATE